jgi:hypothetical protein
MANYTKATNFAAKDGLPTGNAGKVVKGTEIDTEFTSIASAISSKADLSSPALTGTPLAPTAASGTDTTQIATTAFVQAALNGRIVQIVDSVTATGVESFSDTLVGTGHTASITPTSASNKILIMASFGFAQTNAFANNAANAFWTLYRGGTNLGTGSGFGANCLGMANVNTINSNSNIYIQESYQLLDSPNTTSAVTYQTYVRRSGNASAGYNTMGNARIILLEIEQ